MRTAAARGCGTALHQTRREDFIDAVDPGVKPFVRSKTAEGQTRFAGDNIVLFVHGYTPAMSTATELPHYPGTRCFQRND